MWKEIRISAANDRLPDPVAHRSFWNSSYERNVTCKEHGHRGVRNSGSFTARLVLKKEGNFAHIERIVLEPRSTL